MRWLRRISGIVWIFSWYTIYLEIFRWHHMTKSLRFNPPPPPPGTDIRPKAGAPLIAACLGSVAAPLVFLAATMIERMRVSPGGDSPLRQPASQNPDPRERTSSHDRGVRVRFPAPSRAGAVATDALQQDRCRNRTRLPPRTALLHATARCHRNRRVTSPARAHCRNEHHICAYIYARIGILTHALSTLTAIVEQPFPSFW
jgi:hypothetical protein